MIISLWVADGCAPEAAESADPFHLRPFILMLTMMVAMMMTMTLICMPLKSVEMHYTMTNGCANGSLIGWLSVILHKSI